MEYLSSRVVQMTESQTLAMARKSRELQEKGIDVISLSLGEPDFNTPDFIKQAAKEAIDNNFSFYPPVSGYLDLRKSIAAKFKRDNGITYTPEQIVVSTGAKQSIMNVVLSLVNPGDEVILPAPYWVSYYAMVEFAGGIPIVVDTDISSNYKFTPELIEKHITAKTKLLMFSSPSNPTGSAFSENELKNIAQMLSKHKHVWTISDEIYEHINFEGKHYSIANYADMYERTITVNGVSKGFAMTGWRIGYIGAPKEIAEACIKVQGQFTSGATGIAQKAAKAAIDADPQITLPMKEAFNRRRDLLIDLVNKHIPDFKNYVPDGAFYLFPDVSKLFGKKHAKGTISNSYELCMYLLEEAQVALVSGEAFGSPNCIRISYATSDEKITTAINRIAKAIDKLN